MTAKRRQYSAEFKAKVVLQALSGEKTSSDICRTHKLNTNVLKRWRKEFLEQTPSIFERGSSPNEEQKIAELERLVGQLTIQLEILTKLNEQFDKSYQDNLNSLAPRFETEYGETLNALNPTFDAAYQTNLNS